MIHPTNDNILLEVHKSGFTAIEQVDDRNTFIEKATILAVGEDVTRRKAGEIVFFKDYETDKFTEDGVTYVIIQEQAIKCTYIPSQQ